MKITQQTPTILKLEIQSYFASSVSNVLFGLTFLLAGIGVCFLFGNLAVLKCNRLEPTQVDCEITSVNWLGQQTEPIPVKNLQSAELEVNDGSDGNTYRVVLNTLNSKIPLTNTYSSGWLTNHSQNTSLINSFIQTSEQISLKIKQDDRLLIYIFGGIFILAGGALTVSSLRVKYPTSCLFDQDSKQVYIVQKNLWKSELKEEMLEEIKKAEVTQDCEDDYTLSLVMRKGNTIPLQTSSSPKNYNEIAQSINQFLHVVEKP